jgi:hypothetical protein
MKTSEPKPTKEEILKSKFKNSFLDLDYLELYLEAMQEYAEQFHKEKMREELKLFNDWMCSKQYDGLIPTIEQCINDYLNTLNTK